MVLSTLYVGKRLIIALVGSNFYIPIYIKFFHMFPCCHFFFNLTFKNWRKTVSLHFFSGRLFLYISICTYFHVRLTIGCLRMPIINNKNSCENCRLIKGIILQQLNNYVQMCVIALYISNVYYLSVLWTTLYVCFYWINYSEFQVQNAFIV